MTRFSVFWFILVIVSGMTNFLVKQTVQGLDDQLNRVRKQTIDEQKKIHDLTADWTFLNQPELLADLNSRYVRLAAATPKQLSTGLDDIPLRPAPLPEAVPAIAQATPSTPALPPMPPPGVMPSPIVQVAATAAARPLLDPAPAPRPAPPPARVQRAPEPVLALAPAPVRAQPAPATRTASLDGLFAQVAGDR